MIVVCPDVSLDCHVEDRMLDNSIKRVNASPSLNKDKEDVDIFLVFVHTVS